jgi:hypothetical protein
MMHAKRTAPSDLQVAILALSLLVGFATSARAYPLSYVSDPELAAKPIIVVARWAEARFEPQVRFRQEKNSGKAVFYGFGVRTELIVERVIKGDITPGAYKLMLGEDVAWMKHGRPLRNYASADPYRDATDATKPNLWFLSRGDAGDPADKTAYLSLDTDQCVLELYFHILYCKRTGRTRSVLCWMRGTKQR